MSYPQDRPYRHASELPPHTLGSKHRPVGVAQALAVVGQADRATPIPTAANAANLVIASLLHSICVQTFRKGCSMFKDMIVSLRNAIQNVRLDSPFP
jgi:hypothetical protein